MDDSGRPIRALNQARSLSVIPRALDPELIEQRSDESLPTERLEPFLRERLPSTTGELSVMQFGGGHANLTYLLRFGVQ